MPVLWLKMEIPLQPFNGETSNNPFLNTSNKLGAHIY